MSFTAEEKQLVAEALQVYLQVVARQMPPEHVEQISRIAQSAASKLDSVGSGEQGINKPAGISDDWFENVCQKCANLSPAGCDDKVTAKFPGKCDPILHYEKSKSSNK